jgi:hypothetical protein
MSNEELGALYVKLQYDQLSVSSTEAAQALDAELGLVINEIESRNEFKALRFNPGYSARGSVIQPNTVLLPQQEPPRE